MSTAPAVVVSRDLRRGAVIAVSAWLAFDLLVQLLGVGTAVADRYRSLLMPARYTFAIWPLILGGLLAYATTIRRPSQRAIAGHDGQARLLIAAGFLGPAWLLALRFGLISLSVLLVIGMLVIAIAMFREAHDLCRREQLGPMWTVPFSLFLGWIGVSTLINIAVWLVAIGWRGGGLGDTVSTVAMIVIAALVAIGVGLRFADALVPMAVGWVMFGLWIGQREIDLAVSMVVAGVACAIGAGIALVKTAVHRDHAPRHIRLL